jgi:hypothetical protein
MMRAARLPFAATVLVLATVLAGCGILPGPIANPGVRPDRPDIVEPVVQVASGNGPGGPYWAWMYLTRDRMTCLEVATAGSSGSSCGPGMEGLLGASLSTGGGGAHVSGGTRAPGGQSVRVTLADGSTVGAALVPVPAIFGAPDARVYVVTLAEDATPVRLDILDEAGEVLETTDFLATRL